LGSSSGGLAEASGTTRPTARSKWELQLAEGPLLIELATPPGALPVAAEKPAGAGRAGSKTILARRDFASTPMALVLGPPNR